MTTKLETKLSQAYIRKLQQRCKEERKTIKLIKIHGGPFQTMGICDYLGWFEGHGIGIEFKVGDNTLSPIQQEFLNSVADTHNVAMAVTFRRQLIEKESDPYTLLRYAIKQSNLGIYYCEVDIDAF